MDLFAISDVARLIALAIWMPAFACGTSPGVNAVKPLNFVLIKPRSRSRSAAVVSRSRRTSKKFTRPFRSVSVCISESGMIMAAFSASAELVKIPHTVNSPVSIWIRSPSDLPTSQAPPGFLARWHCPDCRSVHRPAEAVVRWQGCGRWRRVAVRRRKARGERDACAQQGRANPAVRRRGSGVLLSATASRTSATVRFPRQSASAASETIETQIR